MNKDEQDFLNGHRGSSLGRYTPGHMSGSHAANRDPHTGAQRAGDPGAGLGFILIALGFGAWVIYDTYDWVKFVVWWMIVPGLVIGYFVALSRMNIGARMATVLGTVIVFAILIAIF